MKRWSIVTLIATFLVVSLFSHVGSAEAATSRVAIISKIEGTVEVQKSGGKKTLKGFKGMSLNQGDIVTTGKKSSVVLKFSNGTSEDDTFVLESSTSVTFSKLSNKSGTTTKVSMLKGKGWVDVKSIKNKDDEFVLETPTAIMGVRGTNFFVGVDPNTGLPSLAVLSGNVNVTGSGNHTDHYNVYPASALTVGGQDELQMIPIDNQILAQMLQSTSAEVMKSILESAQKIINENQALMDRFTSTTFPTEVNQFPLSQNQYTDNVYNLLLALAEEAFNLHKLDGTQLLDLQQQIKEQQLTNNELHQNTGDVDWKFELDALTEKQRLEKLRAEQAKKDALTKAFNDKEQKAKEDKLKQDRLDALEKLWKDKLSQAERDRYERDKQAKLDEANQGNGNSNSNSGGSTPPAPTWPSNPFDLQLKQGDSSAAVTYSKSDEANGVINLLVNEPIAVNRDDVYLVFGSTNPSNPSNPSIQLLDVKRDGESINEPDEDGDGNGDGVFITDLARDLAGVDIIFTITVEHGTLGTKVYNLTVKIADPWSEITQPFDVALQTSGIPTSMNYSKNGDEISELIIEQPILVNSDEMDLVFSTTDPSIQILDLDVTRSDGLDMEQPADGVFHSRLPVAELELRFTITVEHSTLGVQEYHLSVSLARSQG